MSNVTVKFCDLRAAGVCWSGARKFLHRHGIDPVEFRRKGISADELEKTGDAIALRVAEVARGRIN
ncbi:MAG: hypothetical protein COA84_15075 [Robiginitomaculum sp.]|nr:MAG: hypothetical protein COA84_15075 [Robiginitomaculum sp.]